MSESPPLKRPYSDCADERDEGDERGENSDGGNGEDSEDLEDSDRSRHKRRRGSDSEFPSYGAFDIAYRILCPVSKIGAVIGKGGSIIKSLRLETKAKIRVEDVVHGADERVIYVSSQPGSSDRDEGDRNSDDRDGHRGREREDMLCAAQRALFRIHHCITAREQHSPSSNEADDEEDDEPPRQVTARLLVSDSQVGCLIGRGGCIIEQMRKDIAAQIRVLPKGSLPTCACPNDELVQLSGTPALVKKALYAVSSKLYDNPIRDRPHRTSAGLSQSGTYTTTLHVPGSMLGRVGMPSMRSSRADGATEEFMVSVLCPNDRIGSLIGKGGSVVKRMREDSGAKIKVCDQVEDSDERLVQISAIEYMDTYSSPVGEAVMQVYRRLAEIAADKDGKNAIFSIRLLIRGHQLGCLLGKGGQIIADMRRSSRANIRIPPKDELPRCADEGNELVQVSGEAPMVEAALRQVLNRLRSNLFKGRDMGHGSIGIYRHTDDPRSPGSYYRGRDDQRSPGSYYRGRDDPRSPGSYYKGRDGPHSPGSQVHNYFSNSPGAARNSSRDSRRRHI